MPLAHRAAVTTELIFFPPPSGGCMRAYVYVCVCMHVCAPRLSPASPSRVHAPLARSEDAEDGELSIPRRRDAAPRFSPSLAAYARPLLPSRGTIAGPIDADAARIREKMPRAAGPRCHPAFFPFSPPRGIAARSYDNSPAREAGGWSFRPERRSPDRARKPRAFRDTRGGIFSPRDHLRGRRYVN